MTGSMSLLEGTPVLGRGIPGQDGVTLWPGHDWIGYPIQPDGGVPPLTVLLGQVMPRSVPILRFPAEGLSCSIKNSH